MQSENETVDQKAPSFIERARRAQIVASAIEVIAEAGFGQASLAAIAKHAGISKGVISYHFATKDQLMEQVVEDVFAQIVEEVLPQLEGLESAVELLRTHLFAVAGHMREHRNRLAALGEIIRNLRTADGSFRYGVESSEGLYQGLEHIYRIGHESGEFRPFDARAMAVTHQSALDGMFGYWLAHPDHDLDAHTHELAETLLRATRADPEGAPR